MSPVTNRNDVAPTCCVTLGKSLLSGLCYSLLPPERWGFGGQGWLICALCLQFQRAVARRLQTAELGPPRLGEGGEGSLCHCPSQGCGDKGKRKAGVSPFPGPGLKLFYSLLAAVASSGLLGCSVKYWPDLRTSCCLGHTPRPGTDLACTCSGPVSSGEPA